MFSFDAALDRLALGTLLPAFQGTTPPEWVLRRIDEGLAGVTLFGFNIVDDDQLSTLSSGLRAAGDPLISLDEEGGDVTRITHHSGSRYPGSTALGVVDDIELTRQVHKAIAADLARLGVNLNLAPSADVNAVESNPVIGIRSFGADPQRVARHTAAAITGLQEGGVAACAKHFPGHGATHQDSHLEVPVVDAPMAELWRRELVPFQAAVEAGTKTLMTAHVRVPELTGADPATFSSAALTKLLRGDLGYDGVLITDALDMRPITDGVGLAAGSVLSLIAGTDLLCLGPLPSADDVTTIRNAIVEAVRDGRLPIARLEDAAARVAELKAWLASTRPAPTDSGEVGLIAARRAIQVSGDASPLVDPYVVEVHTPPTIAVGEVPWGFAPWFANTVRVDPAEHEPQLVAAQADGRPLVLVVRDGHRNIEARWFCEALLARRSDATVVEMGLPVWRPDCRTYVATYGAAPVNAQAAAERLGARPCSG
jgi:beta-N-acetylhexosaminidase